MWVLMGVTKNEHGVYHARRKVPKHLRKAVAQVLGRNSDEQAWLKRSLGTKDLKKANVLAKPVLMSFDAIFAQAEALRETKPVRTSLTQIEIGRMGEYHFATLLSRHDLAVRLGPENELDFRQEVADQQIDWVEPVQKHGLSGGQMLDFADFLSTYLPEAEAALARGNTAHVQHYIETVLKAFQIELDEDSDAYQKVGMSVLRQNVLALRALQQRCKRERPRRTASLTLQAPSLRCSRADHCISKGRAA
jgi:hypothetical protein